MEQVITPPNATLKKLIIDKDLNYKDVAEAVDISPVSFTQKIRENGSRFTLSEAERIAKFFDMSIEEIFFA